MERNWRKSRTAATATGLKATSVLMIPGVYGDKVRVLHRIRDTASADINPWHEDYGSDCGLH